jgi:hypothetical protein
VDRPIRRGRDLQRADEVFFDEAILRRLQHLRVGQDRPAPRQERRGLRRHVLEFIGDDVDRAGKPAERGLVVIFRAGAGVHDVECAGVLFGRVDVAAQPERGRRERKHAGQLSAAENADGRAGFQHVDLLVLSGATSRPLIPATQPTLASRASAGLSPPTLLRRSEAASASRRRERGARRRKAGIQGPNARRRSFWIPAFAGMSRKLDRGA